ncbi:unnamed protein product [Ectocarpus sp. CCAP 1310/34]|nr:unnamed protein product [Ectocarpus sp. CCAP 1310/34]
MPGEPPNYPRGPYSDLHRAVASGSTRRVSMQLDTGIDINIASDPAKDTPLIIACRHGELALVQLLLDRGADTERTNQEGRTALFESLHYPRIARILIDRGANHGAQDNHGATPLLLAATRKSGCAGQAVTEMLLQHGANPDTADNSGFTPLHIAASRQCCAFMSLILGAGAGVNARHRPGGETPLFVAARLGRLLSVKVLLRFKADALLPAQFENRKDKWLPLDVAAHRGHLAVVRELVQQVGLGGCGGPSGGADALVITASEGRLDIMAFLLDAGVVDNGDGLRSAIKAGHSKSVRLLMERRAGDVKQYVSSESIGDEARTVLFHCFHAQALAPSSCRIMQTLIEAGATTRVNVMINYEDRPPTMLTDLVQYADYLINRGRTTLTAEEEMMHGLRGLRRLLMQKEAVTATSWAWPAGEGGMRCGGTRGIRRTKKKTKPSAALATMMPLLRRRDAKRGMALRALTRRKSTAT